MGQTEEMMRSILTLSLMLATLTLTACAPLAFGAAGAVAADKYAEQRDGDQGLF
jgi:hypothetical protein